MGFDCPASKECEDCGEYGGEKKRLERNKRIGHGAGRRLCAEFEEI